MLDLLAILGVRADLAYRSSGAHRRGVLDRARRPWAGETPRRIRTRRCGRLRAACRRAKPRSGGCGGHARARLRPGRARGVGAGVAPPRGAAGVADAAVGARRRRRGVLARRRAAAHVGGSQPRRGGSGLRGGRQSARVRGRIPSPGRSPRCGAGAFAWPEASAVRSHPGQPRTRCARARPRTRKAPATRPRTHYSMPSRTSPRRSFAR